FLRSYDCKIKAHKTLIGYNHDPELSWYSDSFPDFTLCFEETALVLIPCILSLSLLIITIADLLYAIILQYFHRKHRIYSSGVMFIFWILYTIGAALNFRTVLQIVFNTKTGFDLNNLCPEYKSSFLSRLTFEWFSPLIYKGYKKPLTTDDMWLLNTENKSSFIIEKFNKVWLPIIQRKWSPKDGISSQNINIFVALMKTFWPQMLFVGFIKLITSLLTFMSPLVLDLLIGFMSPDNSEPNWRGYFYASLIFVSPFIESILSGQYDYRNNLILLKIRACIISVVYQKNLKLSNNSRKNYTTGEIVNLMSVDSQRMTDFMQMMNILWSAPLQICVSLYLLWQQLGIATLAGMAFMLLLMPANGFIGAKMRSFSGQVMKMKDKRVKLMNEILSDIVQRTGKMRSFSGQVMKMKDKRVKLMNEILSGIKVFKLYSWETSFKEQVVSLRETEVKSLNSVAYLSGSMAFTFVSAPFFVGLFSFTAFVMMSSDNILDANKIFVSLSLFNIMRMPLGFFPNLISFGALFLVSLRRINEYLNAEEIDETSISRKENKETPIVVENASFKWNKESPNVLNNISLRIKRNKLVAIVGQVGAGKSSLLSSLLGDLDKIKGIINVSGSVAYVPQQAWIQNSTLKQNILFTNKINERFYKKVIDSCALEPDLKILSAGDMTEIGEKGINLSGGQKQRVSLARAVYSNADIYLLDDPLSAVDAHVGRHLMDQVIGPNGILKHKTRLLVTHRASILTNVDQIIVLKDGSISEFGTFEELLANKGDFAEFVAEYLQQQLDSEVNDEELEVIDK
ncbi:unnamed protein product, partial [Medioppia subpectinata]